MAPHMGRRVGGQGLVLFAQDINNPMQQYAVKFFLHDSSFRVERAAACHPVCPAATDPF